MQVISGIYWNRGSRYNVERSKLSTIDSESAKADTGYNVERSKLSTIDSESAEADIGYKNEDSLVLEQVVTRRGRVVLAAVCDGIGGLLEGENASGYIVEKLTEHFYKQVLVLINRGKGRKKIERCWLRCLYEINSGLNRYANQKKIRLGSTLSMFFLWNTKYIIIHLGDSRIYTCSCIKRRMEQLTEGHENNKGGLTKCLGSFAFIRPDIKHGYLRPETGVLLCSDGFYRKADNKLLYSVLEPQEISGEEQIKRRLNELGTYIMQKGEQDNLSAIYLKCY